MARTASNSATWRSAITLPEPDSSPLGPMVRDDISHALLVESTIEFPVQVNGKLRGHIDITPETSREEIEKLALACERVQQFIIEKEVKKVIVVPNKLVNIAVK